MLKDIEKPILYYIFAEQITINIITMNFSDMNQKQLCDAIIEMHKYDNDVDAIISVNEMLEELKWLLSSVVFSEFKKSLIERFPLFYKSNNS